MDIKPVNPLAKHFRQPTIYFKLPSNGSYWPDNALDMPLNSQIPVFPMTNSDEITLKTPDALLNGSGIVTVIQSCCPSIQDAWRMPSIDVDATLIAIRIASYGENMTVSSKCPKCGEEHDYDIDLSSLLGKIRCPDYNRPVEFQGLKIKLRPQQYFSITQTNIVQFEEQKIAQALTDPNIDEDVKNARLKESMQKILALNDKLLVDSTEYIETEDGTQVIEAEFISDFYKNAEGRVTKLIEQRLAEIATEGALPPTQLFCASCSHQYEIPLEFDYASFFVIGS